MQVFHAFKSGPGSNVMGRGRLALGLAIAMVVFVGIGMSLFRPLYRADNGMAGPTSESDIDGELDEVPREGKSPSFTAEVAPILTQYCAGCHSEDHAEGGFVLVSYPNDATAAKDTEVWQRVAAMVPSRRMPPAGHPRPSQKELEVIAVWLDQAAGRTVDPGRVTMRRLNRAEYNNTIHDLVGVTFNPADDFPADDSGDGFDTIGDVLSVSPTLVEKYLTAAEAVVNAATANPSIWKRITTPPEQDYIPFVLRGMPPQRADAVKGLRETPDPEAATRAAEIDRAYYALQAFADRAYRRPITHAEMYRLMRFVDMSINRGEGPDEGLKLALKAILVSPHFLFKVEQGPRTVDDAVSPLSDFELATRLSYFLWSSMPDEELYRLAASRKLREPRTLIAQVRRMLKNPRSHALAEQFAGQWLQTRALTEVARDTVLYPGFDAELVQAMRTETDMFFDDIVKEDQSVVELLTADYTFANERLARHYGIAGVSGTNFRRVSLAGTGRSGILTHASILTVTSGPTRTSPVKRGKWVLENMLGAPAPTPPPGVDGLKDDHAVKPATIREQLERHRSRAECAACHARLDPLGFGLESFDAVGARRERDGESPIDASGLLPDGRTFRGPAELAAVLAERPEDFARCLTQKLLTYGLGRSLKAADWRAVDRVVRHAARNHYRFSSLIFAIVSSDPFMRRHNQPEEMR
jgi:hypothetical protein